MFLLDTVTLSEPRRPTPAPGVMRFFDREPSHFLFTSVIVLGEVRRGAMLQRDGAYRERLSAWIKVDLAPAFAGRILPVTAEVADTWGRIRADTAHRGEPVPPIDALIAATALVHGLTVVTRDTADFLRCGTQVRNPWLE
jgi:toxin FitB